MRPLVSSVLVLCWLVKTVSGLLVVNGLTQLGTTSSMKSIAQARRLGVGTASVLAVIDLIYVPMGRISKMYLIDAAVEIVWITAWLTSDRASTGSASTAGKP